VIDSSSNLSYQSVTARAANGSAANRAHMLRGLDEDAVSVIYVAAGTGGGSASNASNPFAGISLDTTSAVTHFSTFVGSGAVSRGTQPSGGASLPYYGTPGLGWHFVQAVEFCNNANQPVSFYGVQGNLTCGLTYQIPQ